MKQKDGQLTLFGDDHEVKKVAKRTHLGGSSNPIVFMDYEGFLSKFTEKAKTTDDCYTPKDVYEAVVKYVGTITDLTGKVICRPFFPGGDYENAEYPDNCVVIDNPPFSLFTKICRFYTESGVPFFLFGPGLTILSCCKFCTAVVVANQIKFDNGALVKCNFASNLYDDLIVTTAPLLDNLILACPSQQSPKELPKFRYPIELLSTSQLQSLSRGGVLFEVKRSQARIVRNLDLFPKSSGLYGDHLLIGTALARAKEAALARAKEAALARAKEELARSQPVLLSDREARWAKDLDETTTQ